MLLSSFPRGQNDRAYTVKLAPLSTLSRRCFSKLCANLL